MHANFDPSVKSEVYLVNPFTSQLDSPEPFVFSEHTSSFPDDYTGTKTLIGENTQRMAPKELKKTKNNNKKKALKLHGCGGLQTLSCASPVKFLISQSNSSLEPQLVIVIPMKWKCSLFFCFSCFQQVSTVWSSIEVKMAALTVSYATAAASNPTRRTSLNTWPAPHTSSTTWSVCSGSVTRIDYSKGSLVLCMQKAR